MSSIIPARRKAPFVTPPAIHLKAFNAEFAVEDLEREVEIELAGAGEDVRDPILTEAGEMGVADLFGQDGNNRIAADIGASPNDFAVRIEHNPVSGRAARTSGVSGNALRCGLGTHPVWRILDH